MHAYMYSPMHVDTFYLLHMHKHVYSYIYTSIIALMYRSQDSQDPTKNTSE